MTQQELDALQGLCDGATPGEWCAVDKGNTVPSHMVVKRAIGANPISIASAISPRTGNAAFIAAARTALPALISEVRRLTERCEAAESDLVSVLKLVPISICRKHCKRASANCTGWGDCTPEWRGPQPAKEVTPDA